LSCKTQHSVHPLSLKNAFYVRLPSKSASWRCESEAFVRDFPQNLKVEDVKAKLSCETSLKVWKLKRWKQKFRVLEFHLKLKVEVKKQRFRARLPSVRFLCCATSLLWDLFAVRSVAMRFDFFAVWLLCCEISLFAVRPLCSETSLLWDLFAVSSLCCESPLWCETSLLWELFAVRSPLLWDLLLCDFFAVRLLCCEISLLWDLFAVRLLCWGTSMTSKDP